MAPIRRDMVSLEINVVSGTLAKMHLTFHTNSEDAESPCFNRMHFLSVSAALSALIDRAGQTIPFCLHLFPVRLV